ISLATICINFEDSNSLSWFITTTNLVYQIHLPTSTIGTFDFTICVNRTGFRNASQSFTLEINSINTNLNDHIIEDLHIGKVHVFDYTFEFANNNTGISGADVIFQGNRIEWITSVDNGDGTYTISLVPQGLGTGYILAVEFRLEGFQTQTTTLEFNVIPTPIELVENLVTWTQGLDLELAISFVESDSQNPVTGLQVEYSFSYAGTEQIAGQFTETDGLYTATIPQNYWQENNISISISINDESYSIDDPELDLFSTVDAEVTLRVFIQSYVFPVIGLISTVVVAIVGQRIYSKRM
ncbi:MAG: hypothetical protein ACTSQZ_06510, partial [Candidatus Thorarchaeota archaeon]